MRRLEELTRNEFDQLKKTIDEKYEGYKKEKLSLDMSRGKPCAEQLDLARGFFDNTGSLISRDGIDCRNYGQLTGLPEVKELFASLLEVGVEELIIGENSSLALIHDTFARAFSHGVAEGATPWGKLDKVKFLCPSPGYDRHFSICEFFGIEMITVPLNEDGPDMDMVEELVRNDETIKGIICVPKFSNPTGIVYSEETVNRLAAMETAADDFRIFWDNAYLVHYLSDKRPVLKNILKACKEYNNPDRVYIFTSTSKITFAGAGVAVLATSKNNIDYMCKLLSIQTIGSNKINQLLHYRFLKSVDGIMEHMEKHARILKPKFDLVLDIFERELGELGIATWSKPAGGYFISLEVMEGCAARIVELAKEAGVILTPAGATFPYGKDPRDSNIRIAPSFPPLEELEKAMEIVCTCIKKASLEKILEQKASA
ncbi:MAG: aminotransferase class I/II-fold pyridoxal phosphate-dependent enzyme [Halanaerobiaceae bacterium]|nr:aminotransferase class I/II-fold pyridoxal phosphate-dependent enzyme [Halanaerobiaceae bacterium]